MTTNTTLHIILRHTDSTSFKVEITSSIPNSSWSYEGSAHVNVPYTNQYIFDHPWSKIINLKLYSGFASQMELTVTTIPTDTMFNYVFDCDDTYLILHNLVTSGFIDVCRSDRLRTDYINGEAGIRLMSHDMTSGLITNPNRIISKGPIFIETSNMINRHGIISGGSIFCMFKGTKPKIMSLENAFGKIIAEGSVHLYGVGYIDNYKGIIQSKTDQVLLFTESSFNNFDGSIIGYLNVNLHTKGHIENDKNALIRSVTKNVCISSDKTLSNQFDSEISSYGDVELYVTGRFSNFNGIINSSHGNAIIEAGEISTYKMFTGFITSTNLISIPF